MFVARSVKDWWALANKLEEYKAEFKSAWRASELDAVICPTMPYVAVPTGCVKYLVGKNQFHSLSRKHFLTYNNFAAYYIENIKVKLLKTENIN